MSSERLKKRELIMTDFLVLGLLLDLRTVTYGP